MSDSITIQKVGNGYFLVLGQPIKFSEQGDDIFVAETIESLTRIITEMFGVNLQSVAEEEQPTPTPVNDPLVETQNVENNPVNDDEEEDEDIFIIPAASTGGGEAIQESPICVSGDEPDPASEEGLSESCSTDTENQDNYGEGNRETVSHEKGESVRDTAPRASVSKGPDKQSKVLKPQPYTPENTGISQMQLTVLQIICHLTDLNKGPVTPTDINERIFPPPANLTTTVMPLIKKRFIKKQTEGGRVTYLPLKRPDSRKYEPLPVTEEDGVPVIRCEPRNIGSRSNSEGGFKI